MLEYLHRIKDSHWLNCDDSHELYQRFLEYSQQLHQPVKIILSEPDPVKFLAGFLAAIAANCPVFLCNPHWNQSEWSQVFHLVHPDLIWGHVNYDYQGLTCSENSDLPLNNYIMIPTGGTSGQIKFAIHTVETLTNSVLGFKQYFHLDKINSFCVLPLYHVSGLMQFIRSFITKGNLIITDYKLLKLSQKDDINVQDYFISLVPTQLEKIITNPDLSHWLSQFKTVLLGGAKPRHELLEKARSHHIPLAPTYGMTETASQIVTLKTQDFFNSYSSSGQILPHGQIYIINEQGEKLPKNHTGIIAIKSKSLCLGYYPHLFDHQTFITDDIGYLDDHNYLYILGRNSQKIITGGENVFPIEIENVIINTNLIKDVCVIGVDDDYWGQIITAVYVPIHDHIDDQMIQTAIADQLSKFKQPKLWFKVQKLPRNSQGKINLAQVKKIVTDKI
jgi:o-succinylbenzoate---CoA ligase